VGFAMIIGCDDLWVYGFFMGLWWLVVGLVVFFVEFVMRFCWFVVVGGGWWRRLLSFVGFLVAGEYCWICDSFVFVFFYVVPNIVKYSGNKSFSLKSFAFAKILHCKIFYNETNGA
jgi:hypothetical protein